MEIKIKDENNKAEEIKVSVSKTYNEKLEKEETSCSFHVGRELGEELTEEELEVKLKCDLESKDEAVDKIEGKKPMEEIRELLVPIAVHEAKSAFYKLKLAKVVAVEGGKIALKGANVAAKGAKIASERLQVMAENHKKNKKEKGGKNEKTKAKGN